MALLSIRKAEETFGVSVAEWLNDSTVARCRDHSKQVSELCLSKLHLSSKKTSEVKFFVLCL